MILLVNYLIQQIYSKLFILKEPAFREGRV